MSAPDQITDLYRELAIHRVQEAIDKLGRAPQRPARRPNRRGARGGRSRAGLHHSRVRHPRRTAGRALPPADSDLIAAAASLEQLADFSRHTATGDHHDQ